VLKALIETLGLVIASGAEPAAELEDVIARLTDETAAASGAGRRRPRDKARQRPTTTELPTAPGG